MIWVRFSNSEYKELVAFADSDNCPENLDFLGQALAEASARSDVKDKTVVNTGSGGVACGGDIKGSTIITGGSKS